jgi:thiol-disulfide isomerase/thioredoxin
MHRSFLVFGMGFIALMAGALFYAARAPTQRTPAEPPPAVAVQDTPAPAAVHPAFRLPDTAGAPHELTEWSGRNRLLNFWATWCAPCRREIPLLEAFQTEQGETGIQVIGIAVDVPDDVAKYAVSAGFNYPVLVGQDDVMTLVESWGIDFVGLPFTMVVSADGELLDTHFGELHRDQLDTIAGVLGRLKRGELDANGARKALAGE